MNVKSTITEIQSKEILNLYLNMHNNTMKNISDIAGISTYKVSKIIEAHLSQKIPKEHFLILTSKINEL